MHRRDTKAGAAHPNIIKFRITCESVTVPTAASAVPPPRMYPVVSYMYDFAKIDVCMLSRKRSQQHAGSDKYAHLRLAACP
eukprot:3461032-Pleurochrysis_carterae.AAC.2